MTPGIIECVSEQQIEPRVYSKSLPFDDDGFASPEKVEVVWADSFLALRNAIRDRRWRSEIHSDYDCTGIMFAQSCKILHVARTSGGYSAVLLTTSHYDF